MLETKLKELNHHQLRKTLHKKRPDLTYRGSEGILSMDKQTLILAIQDSNQVKKKALSFSTAPEVLTPDQVKELLQISRATFFRLVEAGKIPGATKVGGSWRVWRDQLAHSLQGTQI